jgi:hypothetical protein
MRTARREVRRDAGSPDLLIMSGTAAPRLDYRRRAG